MTSRALKPRATAALSLTPITITDRTCAAATGLEPKVWRALVVRLGVRHVLAGRRMIVIAADFVRGLEQADASDVPDADRGEGGTEEPASVDSLLARIGRARISKAS